MIIYRKARSFSFVPCAVILVCFGFTDNSFPVCLPNRFSTFPSVLIVQILNIDQYNGETRHLWLCIQKERSHMFASQS